MVGPVVEYRILSSSGFEVAAVTNDRRQGPSGRTTRNLRTCVDCCAAGTVMLDHFSILTRSGLVLWSKSFTPAIPTATTGTAANHPVDALIRSAFLEDRLASDRYEREGYTLQWTLANDVELVFIVVYQRILQLAYIPQLLSAVKSLFLDAYRPFVVALGEATRPKGGAGSAPAAGSSAMATARKLKLEFDAHLQEWESTFLKTLRALEREAAQSNRRRGAPTNGSAPPAVAALAGQQQGNGAANSGEDTPTALQEDKDSATDGQDIAKNVEALRNRLKKSHIGGKKGGAKGRAGGATKDSPAGSGTDTPGTPGNAKKSKGPAKEMRRWDGGKVTDKHVAALDFSSASAPVFADDGGQGDLSGWIDEKSMGTKGKDGLYEIADVDDDESEDDDDNSDDEGSSTSPAAGGLWSRLSLPTGNTDPQQRSLFSRLTGNAPLTEADLAPALAAMQSHLQAKNVAADVAAQLCAAVSKSLVGKQVGSFGSIKTEVRKSLERSITRILTPKTSTDILLEISTKRQTSMRAALLASQSQVRANDDATTSNSQPYSLCFVGVNGVGKSTNLAKVCFWLLQNNMRVLIAACDTFRSGAVEQLRVHVRNLSQLTVDDQRVGDGTSDGKNKIELYEKGYGKDAAGIAKEALSYARKSGFDVVLIDTAGRMQDNEPLMRALAKLVAVNSPDKILFVGEALVGNEAVDQLTKFDQSLKDFSGVSRPRGLDGMLLTKFDTSEYTRARVL